MPCALVAFVALTAVAPVRQSAMAPAPGLRSSSFVQGRRSFAKVPALAATSQAGEAYFQFMLGRRLETEGDVEGAIAAHKRAAEVDPRSAEIRAELAGLYARQDRPRDAIEWAEAALTLDAASAEAHRVLGLIYAALVDRPTAASRIGLSDATSDEFAARALSHLERADAETLADASLHFALGRLHVRQRSYQKAIAAFRRLLEEEPGVSEASLLLAEAYEGAGQFDEARRTLEDAIAEEPGLVRARLQLAELFERQGRWSGAAGQYALALEASPSDLELVRRQALAWLQAGEPARARDLLQGLAKNGKAGASELYLLFQAERDLDDLDAADATARKLMQQAPDDVRGPHAVAQVLERRRDYRAISVNLLEPIVARKLPDGRYLIVTAKRAGVAANRRARHPTRLRLPGAARVRPGDTRVRGL
jgi:tetratricopeptide (TPR) repeat protein